MNASVIIPGKLLLGGIGWIEQPFTTNGPEVRAVTGADILVNCAIELVPRASTLTTEDMQVINAPMTDSTDPTMFEVATKAAEFVCGQVRAGKCVFVSCAQGLNRSALVVGLVLRELTGESGAWCVEQIRRLRPQGVSGWDMPCLFNDSFRTYLESLGPLNDDDN